ncbi:uncharacterized protein LOC111206912 [Brassica napus]|uniref:uncharacterized protein LOC111206912 n=1 Tax=Brassica napus TaxID=3708 RepID=UPI000BBE2CF1|nr:uncharacterized protein LOC111206912 [Brassica napus]
MAKFFDKVMDLSPAKTTWKIKVKIIRLWRQYSTCDIDSIEMGDTIHATVNEDVVPIFESFLEEDGTLSPEYLIDIVSQIVESKPLSMVSMMSEEEDYFVKTPQKTISDILETRKVERCYVRCTIAAIDNDMGWYYISCKVCGTKVDMLHNNVHPGGTYELDVRCMLYCTKCKMLNPKLKLRIPSIDF